MSALRDCVLAMVVLAAASLSATSALALGDSFAALLYGGNEIDANGNANAGDLNGYGVATVTFVGTNRVCFTLVVLRIDKPIAAHIHVGRAGINGMVRVPLNPVPSAGNPGVSAACIAAKAAEVAKIKANPTGYYINVHTGAYPDGAVRGQLF